MNIEYHNLIWIHLTQDKFWVVNVKKHIAKRDIVNVSLEERNAHHNANVVNVIIRDKRTK